MKHEFDCLKLEKQLCFPLYAASRETVKMYHPYLSKLDLTYTQYVALMVLWEENQVSVKRMGERLHLDSGTLTPLLKGLEKRGLVTRERSREDERVLLITLTEAGEQLKYQAVTIPAEMAKCVKLSPEEIQQLYTLLYKLLES